MQLTPKSEDPYAQEQISLLFKPNSLETKIRIKKIKFVFLFQ